jgi:hypothetical protein
MVVFAPADDEQEGLPGKLCSISVMLLLGIGRSLCEVCGLSIWSESTRSVYVFVGAWNCVGLHNFGRCECASRHQSFTVTFTYAISRLRLTSHYHSFRHRRRRRRTTITCHSRTRTRHGGSLLTSLKRSREDSGPLSTQNQYDTAKDRTFLLPGSAHRDSIHDLRTPQT